MRHFAAATKTEYNWNELHSNTLYQVQYIIDAKDTFQTFRGIDFTTCKNNKIPLPNKI